MSETKHLATKLAEVMGAIDRIPKAGRNAHFGYDYVLEGDLVDAIRGELSKRHVMITCAVTDVERTATTTKNGSENIRTVVKLVFTFHDGESGETIAVPFINEASDQQDKGVNKAITAAKKYFLLTNFLIATGDDTEHDDGPLRRPPVDAARIPGSSPFKSQSAPSSRGFA